MAFQGEFTNYSVGPVGGPVEGSMKGPVEGAMKGPTKGASQDFLLSKSLIEGLSRHLEDVIPFLL